MKNVSSLKSNNTNSPKTPGGISKSLLTPCRRLGLSRNWRKSGPSPFISPLATSSQSSQAVVEDKKENRKRKERVPDENAEETPYTTNEDENNVKNTDNIDSTPTRNIELPRRKRSKTLMSSINKPQEDKVINLVEASGNCNKVEAVDEPPNNDSHNSVNVEEVSTPVRTKSKTSKKKISPLKNAPRSSNTELKIVPEDSNNRDLDSKKLPKGISDLDNKVQSIIPSETTPSPKQNNCSEEAVYTIKEKSPNDLRKECVVVIQRKIFKNIENTKISDDSSTASNNEKPTQCDSDSDEAPLVNLQKQNSTKLKSEAIDDDNDFIDNKTIKPKPNKKDTKSPKNKLKTNKTTKVKSEKVIEPKPPSQNCFDYDDDDDFDNKKTILIRKSYNKISKPLKSKSTGSISQRDIDNLRDRIEAKKKLLLAQSLTPDTEELRTLIKKWQKGCQDALMELLDLMRTKCPDKERMDHSEMLKALKIPPALVGYDSENDCFNSPDDASIVLGQYKDI